MEVHYCFIKTVKSLRIPAADLHHGASSIHNKASSSPSWATSHPLELRLVLGSNQCFPIE